MGQRFVRKRELHVTLVGSGSRIDPDLLTWAASGLDFAVVPSGIYRHVQAEQRRALIELVRVDGQEEYYVRLDAALNNSVWVPRMPAHVTLFTEPGGRGIGLYSEAGLEAQSWAAELRLPESPWRLDEGGAILGA